MKRDCPQCGVKLQKPDSCACGWEAPKQIKPQEDKCDHCDSRDIYWRAGKIEHDAKGRRMGYDTKRRCYEHTAPVWRNWLHNYVDQVALGRTPEVAREYADGYKRKRLIALGGEVPKPAEPKSTGMKPAHEYATGE